MSHLAPLERGLGAAGPELALRYGRTRPMPGPPINSFVSDKGFRLVIKNSDESLTYPADAVRLPQTDLPVVFRETQIPCREWAKLIGLNP